MNLTDPAYNRFGLVRDMLAAADVIAAFDPDHTKPTAKRIADAGKLLFTGEGSSRLFPTKHAITQARRRNDPLALHTEAGRQADEYNLQDWAILALSNSGKTAEVIKLYKRLAADNHPNLFSLTAFPDTVLQSLASQGHVLACGPEGAVAATKSVLEQALFCQALLEHAAGKPTLKPQLAKLADAVRHTLTTPIDPALVQKTANAPTIYFAGRNDGAAEELTLKTNEITRKKSDFLEGTYAVHGVEEVMEPDDVLIWINPYPDAEQKFHDTLTKPIGVTIIAIADHPTAFPTIQTPAVPPDLAAYTHMAAGWNLLVETGISLGIDLDKPQRARKVGNEFIA